MTEIYDITSVGPPSEPGGVVIGISPPMPVDQLPDWEREFLIRQWLRDHGGDDTRWLIEHLDRQLEEARETALESAEPVWQLADRRGEQIQNLRQENAALARRVAELGVQCAQLAQQCARLRVGAVTCQICGNPCDESRECTACTITEEAAAKRRADH
jgi:hypothetical protein